MSSTSKVVVFRKNATCIYLWKFAPRLCICFSCPVSPAQSFSSRLFISAWISPPYSFLLPHLHILIVSLCRGEPQNGRTVTLEFLCQLWWSVIIVLFKWFWLRDNLPVWWWWGCKYVDGLEGFSKNKEYDVWCRPRVIWTSCCGKVTKMATTYSRQWAMLSDLNNWPTQVYD